MSIERSAGGRTDHNQMGARTDADMLCKHHRLCGWLPLCVSLRGVRSGTLVNASCQCLESTETRHVSGLSLQVRETIRHMGLHSRGTCA